MSDFREQVYVVVSSIPVGRVMTYGDIAVVVGRPYAARLVGGIAHFGDSELPWYRVVNRFGGLASGFPGGREVQRQLLAAEGVECQDYVVANFEEFRWSPYE